jgi:hypothetical protein
MIRRRFSGVAKLAKRFVRLAATPTLPKFWANFATAGAPAEPLPSLARSMQKLRCAARLYPYPNFIAVAGCAQQVRRQKLATWLRAAFSGRTSGL